MIQLKHKTYHCCGFSLSVDALLRIEFNIRKMSIFFNLFDFFEKECLFYCVNLYIIIENGFGFKRKIYSVIIESNKHA